MSRIIADEKDPTIHEQAIDKGITAPMACHTCVHCYRVKLQPLQPTQLVCYWGPMFSQFIPNRDGMTLLSVPNVVPEHHFCHQWKEGIDSKPVTHSNAV